MSNRKTDTVELYPRIKKQIDLFEEDLRNLHNINDPITTENFRISIQERLSLLQRILYPNHKEIVSMKFEPEEIPATDLFELIDANKMEGAGESFKDELFRIEQNGKTLAIFYKFGRILLNTDPYEGRTHQYQRNRKLSELNRGSEVFDLVESHQ